MGWPQIVMIVFIVLGSFTFILNEITQYSITKTIIGVTIGSFVLGAGGFWQVMAWPQIVVICLYAFSIVQCISREGEFSENEPLPCLVSGGIFAFILYMGNFFK